jgi:uncharacterized SAM-binding protein YcdF (DUF218 family)
MDGWDEARDSSATRAPALGLRRAGGFAWLAAIARRAALVALALLMLGGGFLFGGFLRFAEEVASFSQPSPPGVARADGIVVLTGGALRLDVAFDLLKQGLADRLLISGVNPGTSVDTLARLTHTPREWFDCCVDVDYAALNTIGNAEMAARWAADRGFDELILVTSDYHMPRSLWEFERLGTVRSLTPFAVTRPDLWSEREGPSRTGMRVLVTEYAKLVLARLRAAAGIEPNRAQAVAVAQLSE